MTEEKQASHSVSVLRSMLTRLKPNKKLKPSNLHVSSWYIQSEDTHQNEGDVIVDESEPETPQSSESAVRNDADEEMTRNDTLETDQSTACPSALPKWERGKYTSNQTSHLMKKEEEDPETRESQPEWVNATMEPSPEEEPPGSGSHSSVKESPTQEAALSSSHDPKLLPLPTQAHNYVKGTTVLKTEEPRGTPSKPPQLNESREGQTKTQKAPKDKNKHVAKQSPNTVFYKTCESPDSRPTRSVSDPVKSDIRGDRALSGPDSLCVADTVEVDMPGFQRPDQAELTDKDSSRTQKKVKTKNIAQKFMTRLKKKSSQEQNSSSSSNHDEEEEERSVTSTSTEEAESASPTLPATEESFTTVHVRLQRMFTLRDFKLNLEPINLLEEVFSGEEWAKFLPVKESPLQAENNSQSQTESCSQSDEAHCQDLMVVKQQLSANKDLEDQADMDRIPVTEIPSDKVSQLRRRQGKPSSMVFAVPKALIGNGAVKQRKSEVPQPDPSDDDDDVYDFVEVYMLPKNDSLNVSEGNNPPLDLSAVQSSGVLDNSALKSRIHLSKKRKHRPPKKRRRGERSEVKSKFYTSCTSVDLPHHFRASTPSSSVQSVTTSTSSARCSVFYTDFTNLAPACDAEASSEPTPADEKEKAQEKTVKPKLWKLKS